MPAHAGETDRAANRQRDPGCYCPFPRAWGAFENLLVPVKRSAPYAHQWGVILVGAATIVLVVSLLLAASQTPPTIGR